VSARHIGSWDRTVGNVIDSGMVTNLSGWRCVLDVRGSGCGVFVRNRSHNGDVERTDEQGDVVIVVVDRGPSLDIARR